MTPTADVREFVAELEAILSAEYPPEQRHGLLLDAIFQPRIRFFIARIDGRAVGCGGVLRCSQTLPQASACTCVRPRAGAAWRTLLERIETEAFGAGLDVLRLETGNRQLAAIRFPRRCGFHQCGALGAYAAMPPANIAARVFFEKQLAQ